MIEIDESTLKIGANPCPRCRSMGRDKSGNNLHFYGPGKGAFCFSCNFTILSDEEKEARGIEDIKEEDFVGSEFNDEIHAKLKEATGIDPKGYRGISKKVSKWAGVRYFYDESTGEVASTLYPITTDRTLTGYKQRIHPKDFSKPIGETGKECDLFLQFRFKTHCNTVLIVGGEHDALAAYQMLLENQESRGKTQWDTTAVVSPTIGESGAYKQVQKQYAFFNQFKKIVVAMDADPAGEKATEKLMAVLPRNKVYVMKMRMKDPNMYLQEGKQQEFINDFWAAKMHTPAGVHASSTLYQEVIDANEPPMLSLPPFMTTAARMLGGGLVQQEITTILAKTSIGKSTLMSALTEWWALNEPDIVLGVLSLEAVAAKYARNLLSYHLKTPLHRMPKEDRVAFLSQPEIAEKSRKLFEKEDGTPRFFVCDDRGASVEQVQEKVLEMIIHMGVNVLIIDPYSDLLSGLDISAQEELATWIKRLMKEYGLTPIIVSHVRKSANAVKLDKEGKPMKEAPLTEDDAQGSSFLVKASGQTIALERNKQSDDITTRNTTTINILKNRDFGETGPAGAIYYNFQDASLYDLDDWLQKNSGMGY